MSSNKKNIIIPEQSKRIEIFQNSNVSTFLDLSSVSAAVALFEISEKIQNAINNHFSRYNLTQARFMVMLTMYTSGSTHYSPVELASNVGVRPPTMTGILDGLVKEGYVSRKSDAGDRRKVMVSLTNRGKKKIQVVLPDHFHRVSAAFANFKKKNIHKCLTVVLKEAEKSLDRLQAELNQKVVK